MGYYMTKQKISITLNEKMINIIENLLNDERFRNRSHIVELALSKFIKIESKDHKFKEKKDGI